MSKFVKGDRVKINLHDCYYGIVELVESKNTIFEEKTSNLIKADDGFVFWYEDKWLEKSSKEFPVLFPALENENLRDVSHLCSLYMDTGEILSVHKEVYTIADLPKLRETLIEYEKDGHTGYCYAVIKGCITALEFYQKEKGLI